MQPNQFDRKLPQNPLLIPYGNACKTVTGRERNSCKVKKLIQNTESFTNCKSIFMPYDQLQSS